MSPMPDAELSELVDLSTKLLQLLDFEDAMSHWEGSSMPTIILTTPSGREMDIDTAPSWRDVQLPAHLVNPNKGSKRANGNAGSNADGNENDKKEKLTTTTQRILTEKMTGHGHLRARKTMKKIRKKFKASAEEESMKSRLGAGMIQKAFPSISLMPATRPRSRITSST